MSIKNENIFADLAISENSTGTPEKKSSWADSFYMDNNVNVLTPYSLEVKNINKDDVETFSPRSDSDSSLSKISTRTFDSDSWHVQTRGKKKIKTEHKKTFSFDGKKEQKRENLKKLICKNMSVYGSCDYGAKCLYAHNLEEQNIDQPRKKVLTLIKSSDLSHVNLHINKEIYRQMSLLTVLCSKCQEKTCTGGYNCKYGACIKDILICANDLNHGLCENPACELIHLTKKGLVPYYKRHQKVIYGTLLNDDFFKKINETVIHTDRKNSMEISDLSNSDEYGDCDTDSECTKSIFDS